MKQIIGKVYYDRKKTSARKGVGVVEIYFRLNEHCKKYMTLLTDVTPKQWILMQDTQDLKNRVQHYVDIVQTMMEQKMDLTLHNLNYCFGQTKEQPVDYNDPWRKKKPIYLNFIDFMRDKIMEEDAPYNTRKQQMCVLNSLEEFKLITNFKDLTVENIVEFDNWLKKDNLRSDVTVYTYHKYLRKYSRIAYEYDLIKECPYNKYHVNKGESPERDPLLEDELVKMINYPLSGHLERVRDLFIFSAYTGLAYCDVQAFDYNTMTELYEDMYYIDGSRMKTKSKFFTPILPPAMDVLKKYNYKLPKISNQKCNDYLGVIRSMIPIKKRITFHIARHSFATLAMSQDIPIDKVARMLGHKDVRTTQIYAKILKNTVAKHADRWAETIEQRYKGGLDEQRVTKQETSPVSVHNYTSDPSQRQKRPRIQFEAQHSNAKQVASQSPQGYDNQRKQKGKHIDSTKKHQHHSGQSTRQRSQDSQQRHIENNPCFNPYYSQQSSYYPAGSYVTYSYV